MPNAEDILWFKTQFQKEIKTALAGTPFSLDMVTAIACQETGYIWQTLRKKSLPLSKILELCVGDTIDSNGGRSAFPRTKADLVSAPRGQEMFSIARQSLVEIAGHIISYKNAAARPNKFCHGFGIFQYDLQFFRTDPDYFLDKRYAIFGSSLQKCLEELRNAMKRIHWQDKTSLTDTEMACVAIAYNTGGFNPRKGLKQGYFDGSKYYGEAIFDFLRLAKTVALRDELPALTAPPPGQALMPPPTPVESTGPVYAVDTRYSTLRVRSEPVVSVPPTANVIGELPDGHLVRVVSRKKVKGFSEVETSLAGAHYRGFVHASYLKPAPKGAEVAIAAVQETLPTSEIVAVEMPRKPGTVTRRTEIAGPHSLNEAGQPTRNASTADELRVELARIIQWLAVDNRAHKRYQPRNRLTFCNIYAHDYCHLAKVYLPRVWWTPRAIEALAKGMAVKPLYGDTIDEQRANDLFRWLRDFGALFGWRQTGTLSKLQQEVNQGAIGLIVARRKQDGLSGHIVAVVPETEEYRARRNSSGEVVAPVQSQAGATNFRYGTGRRDWWKGDQFADSGFWLHR